MKSLTEMFWTLLFPASFINNGKFISSKSIHVNPFSFECRKAEVTWPPTPFQKIKQLTAWRWGIEVKLHRSKLRLKESSPLIKTPWFIALYHRYYSTLSDSLPKISRPTFLLPITCRRTLVQYTFLILMVQGRNLSDLDLLAPFLILKVFHYRKNKINDSFLFGSSLWAVTCFYSFRWLTQAPCYLVLSFTDLSLCWPTLVEINAYLYW